VRTTELYPSHPERICWGCDRYCAAHDLVCGNGTIRTPHPRELFGDDWNEWAERRHEDRGDQPAQRSIRQRVLD
jgi:hypothetical protein